MTNVRPPIRTDFFPVKKKTRKPTETHTDLPQWVFTVLQEISGDDVDEIVLHRNVNMFLQRWNSTGSDRRSVILLRSINWAVLPLIWRPLFMSDIPVCVPPSECRKAQIKLLTEVASEQDDVETLNAAAHMLGIITGIVNL